MKVLILCNYVTGDEIIVTTTDFSPKHTEVMVIREIVSARMVRLQGKENVPFQSFCIYSGDTDIQLRLLIIMTLQFCEIN